MERRRPGHGPQNPPGGHLGTLNAGRLPGRWPVLYGIGKELCAPKGAAAASHLSLLLSRIRAKNV